MSAQDWPVELDKVFRCWLWTGKRSPDGYGLVWRGQRPSYAHRVVYTAEVGPIEDGLMLDHLCRRRACCNPLHLEPVSKVDNQNRKEWAQRVRRKLCPKGHDMSTARVTPEGGRLCRRCDP